MVKIQFKGNGMFVLNFDGTVLWNGNFANIVQTEDQIEVYPNKPRGLFEVPIGGVKASVDEKNQVWIGENLAVKTSTPFEFKTTFMMLPNGIGKVVVGNNQSTLKIGDVQIQNQDDDWAINGYKAILSTKDFKLTEPIDEIWMAGESGSLMIMDKKYLSENLKININGSFRIVLPRQHFTTLDLNLIGSDALIDGSSSTVDKATFAINGKSVIRDFKIQKEVDLNLHNMSRMFLSKEKDIDIKTWVQSGSEITWN